MPKVALPDLTTLAHRALERAGASPAMADATARALVADEAAAEGVEIPPVLLGELRALAG